MHETNSGLGWRVKWVLVVAVAAALPALAGIRGPRRTVNELSIDNRYHGGQGTWEVGSSTLRAPDGYLAYDASGESPKVTFVREKGPGTEWSFVDRERFERYETKGRSQGYFVSEEQRGWEMKIRATAGPFKGWYLARLNGELVLHKDPDEAATVKMVETAVEVKGR